MVVGMGIMVDVKKLTVESAKVFVTEASDIGLRPGEWPDIIAVVGGGPTIRHYQRHGKVRPNPEIVTYHCAVDGSVIRVLND